MSAQAYCPTCERDVEFRTESATTTTELDGVAYEYAESRAICPTCGNEIFYEPYEQAAGMAFGDAVRTSNGIVPLSVVRDLPKKYRIGKRPLSILLGWGEVTYTRFVNGHVPSKQYSDKIRELYDDPMAYRNALLNGRDRISAVAFSKSLAAVESLLHTFNPSLLRLFELGDYFCARAHGDISRFWVLKLTYLSHGFSLALNDSPIVQATPQAWTAGPVYPELWSELKRLDQDARSEQNEQWRDVSPFTSDEDELLDNVYQAFGRYSGNLLSKITHVEGPWVEARKRAGAQPDDKSSEPILIEDMLRYFTGIVNKYSIKDDRTGMFRYAEDMATRVWNVNSM